MICPSWLHTLWLCRDNSLTQIAQPSPHCISIRRAQGNPEGTSKLLADDEQVTLGIVSCPSPYARGLLGCPYGQLTKEEELQDDVLAPPGSGKLQRYSLTQGQHWSSRWTNILQWAADWAAHVHCAEWKMAGGVALHWFTGYHKWFGWMVWDLEVESSGNFQVWKMDGVRKSGGRVCVWTSRTVRYFCLGSMSTKGQPLQRRLNNQVDKMTCSMEVSQSPSSDAQSFIFLFTCHLLSLIPSSSDALSWWISFLLHIYHSHLHVMFISLYSHYPMQVTSKSHMDTETTTTWSHVYSPTYSPHCNRNDVPWIEPECVTLLYKGSANSPLHFMSKASYALCDTSHPHWLPPLLNLEHLQTPGILNFLLFLRPHRTPPWRPRHAFPPRLEPSLHLTL